MPVMSHNPLLCIVGETLRKVSEWNFNKIIWYCWFIVVYPTLFQSPISLSPTWYARDGFTRLYALSTFQNSEIYKLVLTYSSPWCPPFIAFLDRLIAKRFRSGSEKYPAECFVCHAKHSTSIFWLRTTGDNQSCFNLGDHFPPHVCYEVSDMHLHILAINTT